MYKSLLLLILIFILFFPKMQAQQGFLSIQKKGRTVESYTTGSNIVLYHKYNYTIQGILAHIKKDSFSVLNYVIQRKTSPMGFITFDTVYNGYAFYAKNDIAFVPKKKKLRKLLSIASGASILGGGGYMVLSLVNGIKFGETGKEIVQGGVVQGAAMIGAGLLINKLNSKYYKIGKKYTVSLMSY